MSSVLDAARERLMATAAVIVGVLSEDLTLYPEREIRRRFLDSPAADALTDEQLRSLRARAQALGASFASLVAGELAAFEPWLALSEVAPADYEAALERAVASFLPAGLELPLGEACRKDLRSVPEVWTRVAAIDREVEALAAAFGLPPDSRTPPGYTPPARFISHAHLPTLVERYHRDVAEYVRMASANRVSDAEAIRRTRANRWNDAGN